MRLPIRAAVLSLVLFSFGCGGSGGASGPSTPGPTVELLAHSPGFQASFVTVTDTGLMMGSQWNGSREMATYWPAPGDPQILPVYRENASEKVHAISFNGRYFAGSSRNLTNSVIPRFGFVYDAQEGKMIDIEVPEVEQPRVTPEAVNDDGIVHGSFVYTDGAFSQHKQFTYDLGTKALELVGMTHPERDLGTPADAATRYVSAYSANGKFGVGTASRGSEDWLLRWNVATREPSNLTNTAPPMSPWMVSDDGERVVLYANDLDASYFLWEAGKVRNVLDLIQDAGYGSDWDRINFVSISPSGRYLVCTGMKGERITDAVRINLN
ncbi:MAG: hypothetical protein ACO1SV_15840 [Fimbriimonas sp.]